MKIVNRKQFLNLPNGVLYTKFEPYIFGNIAIKEESVSNDWYYQDLTQIDVIDSAELPNLLHEAMIKEASVPMDFDGLSRDGLYDEKQLFAVFEKEDVVSLVERLKKVIPNYPTV